MCIHFRKIANFGALSKIEKYIKIKNQKPYSISKFIIFYRLQKNQYENFTNFVIPVKFPYWFSFIFYGFGIFHIFQIFCALPKNHSAQFCIRSNHFFEVRHLMYKIHSHSKVSLIYFVLSPPFLYSMQHHA